MSNNGETAIWVDGPEQDVVLVRRLLAEHTCQGITYFAECIGCQLDVSIGYSDGAVPPLELAKTFGLYSPVGISWVGHTDKIAPVDFVTGVSIKFPKCVFHIRYRQMVFLEDSTLWPDELPLCELVIIDGRIVRESYDERSLYEPKRSAQRSPKLSLDYSDEIYIGNEKTVPYRCSIGAAGPDDQLLSMRQLIAEHTSEGVIFFSELVGRELDPSTGRVSSNCDNVWSGTASPSPPIDFATGLSELFLGLRIRLAYAARNSAMVHVQTFSAGKSILTSQQLIGFK